MPTPPKKPSGFAKTVNKPAASGMAALHQAEDRVSAEIRTHAQEAGAMGEKVAAQTAQVADQMKKNAENVVALGASAARKGAEAGTAQVERLQGEAQRFTAKASEGLRQQAEKGSEAFGDMSNMAQRQMEAAAQCGNIVAGMAREMSEELFGYANACFSNQVQISKDIFTCRTINDLFDLQNKAMKSHLDGFFSETAKLSEMMFNHINRAAEPLTECMQEASERFNRKLAA